MDGSQAQKSKDLGNAAFKGGDYPSAIGHYTSAILADPKNPTFPLNRAAAYLKLGKHQDAERDCSAVLALDNNNVKALFRRGQARQALDKLSDAQEDLKKASGLEPANESVKQELDKVNAAIQKQSAKQTRSLATPISPETKPRRRRVPIKIVDPPEPAAQKPTPDPPRSDSAANADLLTPVSTRPLQSPTPQPLSSSPPKPTSPPPPKSFQEAKQTRSSRVGGGIFRSSGSHTILKSPSPQPTASTNTSASSSVSSKVPGSPAPTQTSTSPPPPTSKPTISLFDFTKTWESLSTVDERWALMQSQHIPPQSLPAFFKTSLDPTFLSTLLSTLLYTLKSKGEDTGTRNLIREYMINLSRVARFSMILLLMSKEERTVVREIWTILAASSDDEETENTKNRRAWGIVD